MFFRYESNLEIRTRYTDYTDMVCERLSVMQSLAQCEKNVVKITQNRVFCVGPTQNTPPSSSSPTRLELLMGNLGTLDLSSHKIPPPTQIGTSHG